MPHLLDVLDAIVRSSPGRQLRASVCVGVRGRDGDRWWRADLGPAPTTEMLPGPAKADAVLLMDDDIAAAILAGSVLPASSLEIEGDRDVMRAFLDGYLSRASALDVRVQNS